MLIGLVSACVTPMRLSGVEVKVRRQLSKIMCHNRLTKNVKKVDLRKVHVTWNMTETKTMQPTSAQMAGPLTADARLNYYFGMEGLKAQKGRVCAHSPTSTEQLIHTYWSCIQSQIRTTPSPLYISLRAHNANTPTRVTKTGDHFISSPVPLCRGLVLVLQLRMSLT